MNIRHAIYAIASIGSLIWAWTYGLAWAMEGGDLMNLPSFFIDAFNSGPAAAFLTIDILVVWAAFLIWVIPDAQRIGLGTKTGVLFFALSFLGTCFAFPLYLIRRERHLAAQQQAG